MIIRIRGALRPCVFVEQNGGQYGIQCSMRSQIQCAVLLIQLREFVRFLERGVPLRHPWLYLGCARGAKERLYIRVALSPPETRAA